MNKTIEIPRGLAERLLANDPNAEHDAMLELRALLATPAVECRELSDEIDLAEQRGFIRGINAEAAARRERQEPVAYLHEGAEMKVVNFFPTHQFLYGKTTPLYTSPPAPAAVVLPDRKNERPFGDATTAAEYNEARGFNLAIDKFKELNK